MVNVSARILHLARIIELIEFKSQKGESSSSQCSESIARSAPLHETGGSIGLHRYREPCSCVR